MSGPTQGSTCLGSAATLTAVPPLDPTAAKCSTAIYGVCRFGQLGKGGPRDARWYSELRLLLPAITHHFRCTQAKAPGERAEAGAGEPEESRLGRKAETLL
jgi:hypothetical protein